MIMRLVREKVVHQVVSPLLGTLQQLNKGKTPINKEENTQTNSWEHSYTCLFVRKVMLGMH